MDKTHYRPIINSHAALLASLLEHSGHLNEWLDVEDISFDDCCRYVFYSFSHKRDKELINAIQESSSIHMSRLSMNDEPVITDCFWLGTMEKDERIKDIEYVNKKWTEWKPTNNLEQLVKNTFEEMF